MARLVAKFRTPCLGKCQKSTKTRHNTYPRAGEKDETIFALVSAARWGRCERLDVWSRVKVELDMIVTHSRPMREACIDYSAPPQVCCIRANMWQESRFSKSTSYKQNNDVNYFVIEVESNFILAYSFSWLDRDKKLKNYVSIRWKTGKRLPVRTKMYYLCFSGIYGKLSKGFFIVIIWAEFDLISKNILDVW